MKNNKDLTAFKKKSLNLTLLNIEKEGIIVQEEQQVFGARKVFNQTTSVYHIWFLLLDLNIYKDFFFFFIWLSYLFSVVFFYSLCFVVFSLLKTERWNKITYIYIIWFMVDSYPIDNRTISSHVGKLWLQLRYATICKELP